MPPSNSAAPSPVLSADSNSDLVLSKKISALEQSLENLERSQCKLLRGVKDSIKGYSELGMALNGFSLEHQSASRELDNLGEMFDKIGGEGHDLVLCQVILAENIQICHQFCSSMKVRDFAYF